MNINTFLQIYPITNKAWSAPTTLNGSFTAELSENDGDTDPWNRPLCNARFVGADMDGSNEDTYGWRYAADIGNFEVNLLLIND